MLTCQQILDFLMQYLDRELPPEEIAHFEEHLATCPPCVDYMRTYRETVRLGKVSCCDEASACRDVPEELIQAILAARRSKSS